jgi:predicted ABC-type ATPase
MREKRLRMFAGPNGSGKSTITNEIGLHFDLGTYVNADDIEKQIREQGSIGLSEFQLEASSGDKFESFLHNHSLYKKAIGENFPIELTHEGGEIRNTGTDINSYGASILADFIRDELIGLERKVSFETVMSHPSKIEILKKSKELGYKNYLYFISTENVEINKARVKARVTVDRGHFVPDEKIEQRYFKSLELLKEAIKYTYRTFVFDNTGEKSTLVLDIFNAREVTFQSNEIPVWVDKYIL